jgi:hypothetical protein
MLSKCNAFYQAGPFYEAAVIKKDFPSGFISTLMMINIQYVLVQCKTKIIAKLWLP